MTNSVIDIWGRWHLLNLVRPVTRWRLFRAWAGWPEFDSMIGPYNQARFNRRDTE